MLWDRKRISGTCIFIFTNNQYLLQILSKDYVADSAYIIGLDSHPSKGQCIRNITLLYVHQMGSARNHHTVSKNVVQGFVAFLVSIVIRIDDRFYPAHPSREWIHMLNAALELKGCPPVAAMMEYRTSETWHLTDSGERAFIDICIKRNHITLSDKQAYRELNFANASRLISTNVQ